ncbi:MAG: zinc-ribbon domain-containing protein [Deltaproteobacteria bacterium]|nr:zinc-ribbon domain-containing protein [Deltaproteobacteria bacterium]
MELTIECPECGAKFSVDSDKMPPVGAKMKCSVCEHIFVNETSVESVSVAKGSSDRYTVLVADDSPDVCDVIEGVFRGKNVDVVKAYDGAEALAKAEDLLPHVAILDVALSKLYGFEVCLNIKAHEDMQHTKVILLPSLYDKTRYKRNPVSLHGADDYIERHHIETELVGKIDHLLGPGSIVDEVPESVSGEASAAAPVESVPSKEEIAEKLGALPTPVDSDDDSSKEKARKLARIIVSDIALYSSEEVDAGIRNGNFYDTLKEDIKDGIRFFRKRFPSPDVPVELYLKEAFEEFRIKRTNELKGDG